MRHRILFLTLALLAVSALAGAATLPAPPAPAAPALANALPWLQPAANSTPEKPRKPGTGAPLGAVFKSGCSSACLQEESACYNGCGGDHSCNVNCNNDYYCCLQACDPNLPQCF
jgi:poly(3-hydroxybutyrate) depolymerase